MKTFVALTGRPAYDPIVAARSDGKFTTRAAVLCGTRTFGADHTLKPCDVHCALRSLPILWWLGGVVISNRLWKIMAKRNPPSDAKG